MTTEAEWPVGYRIGPPHSRPPEGMVDEFRHFPVPVVGDCLGRSVGTRGLRPFHAAYDEVLCGPALTVRVRPGDNLMLHKAMLIAEPGDVIVVDGGGDLTQALIGGLMRTTAVSRRLAGFVIDGAIRDVAEWAARGLPVFAAGNTHRGPSKVGPGEINVPIACAGLAVSPGDLVLGDADGVIAVRPEQYNGLADKCRDQLAREDRIRRQNASGKTDVERIDSILRAQGLPV